MKKILFVATVVKGHIDVFHIPYLKMLKEEGWEVSVAARNNFKEKKNCVIEYCDNYYDIPFERNPLHFSNINAYKKLRHIIKFGNFDIIHCHTPVGGGITRLAAKNVKRNSAKLIYTAHGFHFFDTAPIKNWLIYYPVEKWLSKYTDTLITINKEDYERAKSNFKMNKLELIQGVGINLADFPKQTMEIKNKTREKYSYEKNDYIIFYAAELNENKNQNMLIDVVSQLRSQIPDIKLLLAGTGKQQPFYEKKIKSLGLEKNVYLLGYRTDIKELLLLSDIAVASSRREGLPVNIMEAMAVGLPVVATNVRGHRDLISNGINGFLISVDDTISMKNAILEIYKDTELASTLKKNTTSRIERYSVESILEKYRYIYS